MLNYSLVFVFYRKSENAIKKAINFVLSEVNVPALNHPEININKEIKCRVTNTRVRINSFKKTWYLVIRMNRFLDAPKSGK